MAGAQGARRPGFGRVRPGRDERRGPATARPAPPGGYLIEV